MKTLRDEIVEIIDSHSCGQFLADDVASRIVDRIADVFVEQRNARWWWDRLKVPAETLAYGSDDISHHLQRLLAPRNGPFYLVVTDNEFEPWPIVEADLEGVTKVIQEAWFFEYFLCDASCQWVVFDTHHNCLVSAEVIPPDL
jgi:hypothetical protein